MTKKWKIFCEGKLFGEYDIEHIRGAWESLNQKRPKNSYSVRMINPDGKTVKEAQTPRIGY